ncbi:MAG: hypothetical protein NT154_18285 [Verrucomicrobia bacterium]|nr:hypothetical protein [Verrucomicrobiota bacterium]
MMGWDKQANRYDLHPIVRGVVWAALAPAARRDRYLELHIYFDAIPKPRDWKTIHSIDELQPAIELFQPMR